MATATARRAHRSTRPGDELDTEAGALLALERAIENGANKTVIDKAHARLEEIRTKAIAKAKRAEEREQITRDITLRKNAERQTALQRKGAEAAATVRESGHFGVALQYKGIRIVCNPSATADPALRLNALVSFRAVLHFLNQEAERDVANAALLAQGKSPAESWTVEGLVRRISDDLRTAISNGCASISVGRTE